MTQRKKSKKREAILDVVRSTKTHPSAEWVYSVLKPDYPALSLGTVYRNLSLLKEQGELVSIGNINGQERFDGDVGSHAHFVCSGCGEIIDLLFLASQVDLCEIVDLPEKVQAKDYRLTVYGVCENCCV